MSRLKITSNVHFLRISRMLIEQKCNEGCQQLHLYRSICFHFDYFLREKLKSMIHSLDEAEYNGRKVFIKTRLWQSAQTFLTEAAIMTYV